MPLSSSEKDTSVVDSLAWLAVISSPTLLAFSEELRGMEGACAQLEERIGKIKDGAQKVMAQKGHNSVSQYIRQLPKVRSILEEDAATVQMNIAKIMEIKQSLDAL